MKNTTVNGTPLSNTVADHTSDTSLHTDELLSKLRETEQLLKETQLHLCEMEFEKVEYNRKYLYFERQADYWEDQTRQYASRLQTILDSKFWKLRGHLLAPFNRFRKDAGEASAPAPSESVHEFPAAEALPALPAANDWESALMAQPRIAVQVHVFYPDLIKDISDLLSNIPYPYDLYITTTESYKATYIKDYLSKQCSATNYFIAVVENRGRDVIPFLNQLKPVISGYDYFCHIHTKRSLLYDIGNQWRRYLYENLLGSTQQIRQIFAAFEQDARLGLIFPEFPEYIKPYVDWAGNKHYAEELMGKMGFDAALLPDEIIFPAGTMFWARTCAVKDFFALEYSAPEECGQTDGTVMHAVERLWVYVAQANGYTYRMTPSISADESV